MSNDLSSFGIKRVPRQKRFAQEAIKVSDPDRRELEISLLKPEPIPNYVGRRPSDRGADPMYDLTVKIVFSKTRHTALFERHFAVSQVRAKSCYRLSKMLSFLRAMERGEITYDEEHKLFTVQEGKYVQFFGRGRPSRKSRRGSSAQ